MAIFQFQRFLVVAAIAMSMLSMAAATGTDSITCEMEMTDYTFSTQAGFQSRLATVDEWSCVDESDEIYELAGEWERLLDEFDVRSGETVFHFQDIILKPAEDAFHGVPTIVVHAHSKIQIVENAITSASATTSSITGRKLAVARIGSLEVLVVRVTDSAGEQPRLGAADISDRIFATTGGVESLKSQIASCSGDQLELYESTRDSNIVDGVLEITIAVAVADYSHDERKDLERVVNNKLSGLGYSVRSFGLVLYIMPENTNLGQNNVLGYAYVGGVKSVYKGIPSFQTVIHEIGHNLGLSHSGLESGSNFFFEEYGDTTCQMGYSIQLNYYDYPQKCFNGAKSYELNWYNKSAAAIGYEDIDITEGSSWRGKLAGVHDYFSPQYDGNACNGYRVVAKIGTLYISFNRAEDFTKDAPHANTVVVTERVIINNRDYSRQKTNGILAKGGVGQFTTSLSEAVTVMICDISYDDTNPAIIDYADVIVFRNDDAGSVVKSCDREPPTNKCVVPTDSPSAGPTSAPTVGPTASPSSAPTAGPTTSPTAAPTAGPTASPTSAP
eukprot:CAMPEP_0172385886 /NCGR_PEP_ID=MMETSP1061-20121228/3496_1 /TAXON_ID=37318 /ORGANISM="Pseudo-nitzschia pungens, Strain cf. pungens" /LENGTH=556 /DNA_ID=CAMNT_0013115073 /DNA_START=324 /DNA_END=1990 /DNA_ORIENTATION=+